MTVRAVSYGGGQQSVAMLVLAATGRLDFSTFLFANVGDDSEHPGTIAYHRDVALPYAERHGLELLELYRTRRDGSRHPSIVASLYEPGRRTVHVPARVANGAPGNRSCTGDWKIKVVTKELRRRGATKLEPAVVAIGISTDEWIRATSRKPSPVETPAYPLLELGLSRLDCQRIITAAGLPLPPKSSCYFCPFKTVGTWAVMARDEPELFAQAVEVEAQVNRVRDRLGKDHLYLSSRGRPLLEAVDVAQDELPYELDEGCASASACWT